jgi:hypothetical protein
MSSKQFDLLSLIPTNRKKSKGFRIIKDHDTWAMEHGCDKLESLNDQGTVVARDLMREWFLYLDENKAAIEQFSLEQDDLRIQARYSKITTPVRTMLLTPPRTPPVATTITFDLDDVKLILQVLKALKPRVPAPPVLGYDVVVAMLEQRLQR